MILLIILKLYKYYGIGMTKEKVDKYINQIAFSGAEKFIKKYKNMSTTDSSNIIFPTLEMEGERSKSLSHGTALNQLNSFITKNCTIEVLRMMRCN